MKKTRVFGLVRMFCTTAKRIPHYIGVGPCDDDVRTLICRSYP